MDLWSTDKTQFQSVWPHHEVFPLETFDRFRGPGKNTKGPVPVEFVHKIITALVDEDGPFVPCSYQPTARLEANVQMAHRLIHTITGWSLDVCIKKVENRAFNKGKSYRQGVKKANAAAAAATASEMEKTNSPQRTQAQAGATTINQLQFITPPTSGTHSRTFCSQNGSGGFAPLQPRKSGQSRCSWTRPRAPACAADDSSSESDTSPIQPSSLKAVFQDATGGVYEPNRLQLVQKMFEEVESKAVSNVQALIFSQAQTVGICQAVFPHDKA